MAEISLDMGAPMTPLLLSLDSYFVYIWHSYACHLYYLALGVPLWGVDSMCQPSRQVNFLSAY